MRRYDGYRRRDSDASLCSSHRSRPADNIKTVMAARRAVRTFAKDGGRQCDDDDKTGGDRRLRAAGRVEGGDGDRASTMRLLLLLPPSAAPAEQRQGWYSGMQAATTKFAAVTAAAGVVGRFGSVRAAVVAGVTRGARRMSRLLRPAAAAVCPDPDELRRTAVVDWRHGRPTDRPTGRLELVSSVAGTVAAVRSRASWPPATTAAAVHSMGSCRAAAA